MSEAYVRKFSRRCYFLLLAVPAAVPAALFISEAAGISLSAFLPDECSLYALTGYYCPGCGGTRAVTALLSGRFVQCFLYHPAVALAALLGSAFIVTHTLDIITGGRVSGMKFRPVYLYLIAVTVVLQWLVKNFIYFYSGVHVI